MQIRMLRSQTNVVRRPTSFADERRMKGDDVTDRELSSGQNMPMKPVWVGQRET